MAQVMRRAPVEGHRLSSERLPRFHYSCGHSKTTNFFGGDRLVQYLRFFCHESRAAKRSRIPLFLDFSHGFLVWPIFLAKISKLLDGVAVPGVNT